MTRTLFTLLSLAALAMPADKPGKALRTHVRVPLWLDSKTEGSAATLAAKDLKAQLGAQPAKVLALAGPAEGLLLLVVFDIVGSLTLAEPAKEALIAEFQKLPDSSRVALLRAQDGLRVVVDPTAEKEVLGQAVRDLPVSGKAGLFETVESVERVADAILNKTAVRVAVLYITDSDVYNYREDFTNPVINYSDSGDLSRAFPEGLVREKGNKLIARLAGNQTPLFIVHLDYRSDRVNEAYQVGLRELASVTGGKSVFCRSNAEIPSAISEMMAIIISHYSATLELPKRQMKNLTVDLALTNGGDGPSTLNYRTRFAFKQE